MDVIHPRCAGLDLGKDMLVAAVRIQDGGKVRCEHRDLPDDERSASRAFVVADQ